MLSRRPHRSLAKPPLLGAGWTRLVPPCSPVHPLLKEPNSIEMVSPWQDLMVFGYREVVRRSVLVTSEQGLVLVAQNSLHWGGNYLDELGLGARLQLAACDAPEMHVPGEDHHRMIGRFYVTDQVFVLGVVGQVPVDVR